MSPVSTSTIDGSSEDILRVIGRRNDAARSPERAQRRHAPRYRILRHVDQFGGDEQIFNRHKSVLDAMGDQAAHIGPSGAGTIAKFVHNCISAVLGAALAEVFTMGVKAGSTRSISGRRCGRARPAGCAPSTGSATAFCKASTTPPILHCASYTRMSGSPSGSGARSGCRCALRTWSMRN
jgi:hypothetical protein